MIVIGTKKEIEKARTALVESGECFSELCTGAMDCASCLTKTVRFINMEELEVMKKL